ncbi:MAG: hypothetical protein CSB49_05725 [Proteobacteria bacterium]|nr:MAG: hypothetical protein CSB49_05725 [Pseudomonadota bacterium]
MNVPALNILPSDQRRFGRYRMLCKLASGGMATLYLARFASGERFEKHVAIKRIHEHLIEDAEFLQMFIDEAQLAARISHPNVAQVIEFGADPAPFIAMEFVDGESLTALIRRAQPPHPVCARIVAQAAAGLHAAHELRNNTGEPLGVVHRDVSPHNILISYEGVVKVVDFGVARARGNLHTTTAGTVKGKFAYMSPEQARMEMVDRRSDIFALGIVLYEITTRYRLFKAPNEAATVSKVLHADIVPPSVLVPHYPPTLERIVLKALNRDPSERYESAEEMQGALEAFVMEQGSPLLPSAIGQLMRSVFSDRIAEKRALLQRAEGMTDISQEVDIGSMPSLTMGGATVSVAKFEAARRQRRRQRLIGAAIGLLVLVGVGGLGAYLFDVLAGEPSNVSAPAPKLRPDPLPPTKVRVTIGASPTSARIVVDGKEVSNPYSGSFQPRAARLAVSVSAEGYATKRLEVSLAEVGTFKHTLALEKLPADTSVAGKGSDSGEHKATDAKQRKKKTKKTKKTRRPKKRESDLFGDPYEG